MNRRWLGVMIAALTCVSCMPHSAENGSPSADNKLDLFCQYVGNSADKQYCQTTFIQLLAHPELFDAQRIMVRGWVLEMDGVVAMFPSEESVQAGELNASIVLLSGPKRDELLALLQRSPTTNPRMLTVAGEFRTRHSISLQEEKLIVRHRFGGLYEVDQLRP